MSNALGGWVRKGTAIALLGALGACVLSPGVNLSDSARPQVQTTSSSLSDNEAGADAHIAAKAKAVEITDDLVAQQRADLPKGIPAEVESLFAKPGPYVIGPGDVLNIVVWDHPELTMPAGGSSQQTDPTGSNSTAGYAVDESGMIQYAYVGMFKVGGLTESQARNALATELNRYLKRPQVTLRIQAYRSRRVYVDGEVHAPGLQMINNSPMTLPEAINRAGGFTATADRSSVAVTRGDLTVKVNIPGLIAKGVNPARILLRDGDMVRVYSSADSKVFVLGEVGRASTVTLNNGVLTLNEALGDAGGVNQNFGDAHQVFVIRGKGGPKPIVYHLDASTPEAVALADSFELKPNDVVFVDASSLARWSRVVSLLVPNGLSSSLLPVPLP
ncbi:polysaccharide biosynthesis/export family protein [Paraburkholderia mimosarum]|uniref:polysaccharide biosynthesis/export family protein n=1 Tax=Paraburkholderia mimosarum TaxID=312026 RepID=UPI0039C25420